MKALIERAAAHLALVLLAAAAQAEVKKPDEFIRTKLRINYQKLINPGVEVPKYVEYYSWTISGKVAGEQVYDATVPVFSPISMGFQEIGRLAIGTEVSLDRFTSFHGRIYYEVPFPDRAGKLQQGFVNGDVIERNDSKSYSPGK